jgi:hypothetical protein
MDCPECGVEMVTFAVPADLRELLPGAERAAAVCPSCLALRPADDPDDRPDFERFGPAFPTGEAAVPMALGLGLLDSLAIHREAIVALFDRVERAGTDPLLVLGRLPADPPFDIERRRHQLEQLR